MTDTTAHQAAARIREALEAGATSAWLTHPRDDNKWRENQALAQACHPNDLRAILDRMDELAKDAARLREALAAFRKAHEMPVTGDTSSFEWGKQTMRYPGEHSGGYLCSKHGLGYTSSCVCCRDEFARYEEQLERKARWNRDTALSAANKQARAALTNKD